MHFFRLPADLCLPASQLTFLFHNLRNFRTSCCSELIFMFAAKIWMLRWHQDCYVKNTQQTYAKGTRRKRGSPIGSFNPVIPTQILPQSRSPDGFYQLIPIMNICFKKCLTEVSDSLIFGEPREDGGIRKVVRSKSK